GNAGQAAEARLRLARVGIDTVVGAVTDFEALIAQPDLTSTQSRLTSRQVAERIATIAELQVVDVRGPGEFAGGTLPGAVNLPLPRLRELMGKLNPARPVLVTCAGVTVPSPPRACWRPTASPTSPISSAAGRPGNPSAAQPALPE